MRWNIWKKENVRSSSPYFLARFVKKRKIAKSRRRDLKFITEQVISLPFFQSFFNFFFFSPRKIRTCRRRREKKEERIPRRYLRYAYLSTLSNSERALRQDSKDIIEVEAMSWTRAHGSCRGIFVGKAGSSSSFCRYRARCARQGETPVQGAKREERWRGEEEEEEERRRNARSLRSSRETNLLASLCRPMALIY